MTFVFIVYNIAIHEEIMEILDKLDLKSYTRWEEVTGVENSALAVVAGNDEARLLMEEIRQLRKTAGKEGVKAFCWRVEDIT